MESLEVVRSMIAAIECNDLDAAGALMADDIEYDNVPMGKVHGSPAVLETLRPFLARYDEVQWVIHREASTGAVVMNERLDRFRAGDRWVSIAVVGVFEVRDGRVALWRDYFDLAAAQSALS